MTREQWPESGWKNRGKLKDDKEEHHCEWCDTEITHRHRLFHPAMGEKIVGRKCAQRLLRKAAAAPSNAHAHASGNDSAKTPPGFLGIEICILLTSTEAKLTVRNIVA